MAREAGAVKVYVVSCAPEVTHQHIVSVVFLIMIHELIKKLTIWCE